MASLLEALFYLSLGALAWDGWTALRQRRNPVQPTEPQEPAPRAVVTVYHSPDYIQVDCDPKVVDVRVHDVRCGREVSH